MAIAKFTGGKSELQSKLGLGSNKEWLEWLRSKAVRPYWVELWNCSLAKLANNERGPGLHAIQRRIASEQAQGELKYSSDSREDEKEGWDNIDHLACFVYLVKHKNKTSRDGVFYKKSTSEPEMDQLVWALKDIIRGLHAPSQIGKPNGGTAIFGTVRMTSGKGLA